MLHPFLRPQALLLDEGSGKVTHTLTGHLDYSFAAAWHPNGLVFATGNQVRAQWMPSLHGRLSPIEMAYPSRDVPLA